MILNASLIVSRGGIDSTCGDSSRHNALNAAALRTSRLRSSCDTQLASCATRACPRALPSVREDGRVALEVRKEEISGRDLCTVNQIGLFHTERGHTVRTYVDFGTTPN